MSEKYNRYVSKEITVFTVSGNGVMAIGYITSVFYEMRFQFLVDFKKMEKEMKIDKREKISKVVVVGTSAGGLSALKKLISQLSKDFPLPILVVRHISPDATGNVLLNELNKLNTVKYQHAKRSQTHIDRIRAILKTAENENGDDRPT